MFAIATSTYVHMWKTICRKHACFVLVIQLMDKWHCIYSALMYCIFKVFSVLNSFFNKLVNFCVFQKWKSIIYLYIFSSTKIADRIQKYPFCVTRGFFVYLPTFIPFHMYMCLTETAQTHTRLGATWNWNFPALDCGPCLPCFVFFFFFLIVVSVNKERYGEGVFSSFTFALSSSFFVYFLLLFMFSSTKISAKQKRIA